ncbi:hypothetical protein R1flu_009074 [Riccia fluitans]|uniref:Uncharacterized protein n=1 Tax=Riccia fluitans TaxID=41844 RepID=A0ABD1Z111_9MARC
MLGANCHFVLPSPITSFQIVPVSNHVNEQTVISNFASRGTVVVTSPSTVSITGINVRANCSTKNVERSSFSLYCTGRRRVLPAGITNSLSRRVTANVRASCRSRNAERISCLRDEDGRRRFLSLMSGAAWLTFLERNSAAFAAEEGSSNVGAAESVISGVEAPEEPATDTPAEGNALIRKLLARSKANKEKNDKARLDDYYRRNFKEYFEFIEGTVRRKKAEDLTEAEKGIIEWLKTNR